MVLPFVTGATTAHHSQAMFGETAVWVTGTVVRYRPVDPHVMIELRESGVDGAGRKWSVEGPRRGRLEWILQNNGDIRADQILKVGDTVSVCGFLLKKDLASEPMYADWPSEQGRFVHGQLLVMPDGRMQSWGPYGTLTNCVRRGDSTKMWVNFLDRDPLAHRQWCAAIGYTRPAQGGPLALADEVNNGLAVPCR